MLSGVAFDESVSMHKRHKARKEFLNIAKLLNMELHARIMALDHAKGEVLSQADIMTSTHLLLMTMDMLSTLQQEVWVNDPKLKSSD